MISKSQPGLTTVRSGCNAARIKRFARFLCTAFPTVRPAEIANRDDSNVLGKATNTISGWAKDFPNRRTRFTSADLFSLNLVFTCRLANHGYGFWVQRSSLPVDLFDVVVLSHGQAVTTSEPSGFQYFPPAGGSHAVSKAMHANTTADFGLVSSLRHLLFLSQ
jgi:hypothetical protein